MEGGTHWLYRMPHATLGVVPTFHVVVSSGALSGSTFEPRSPIWYVVPFAVTVTNVESPPIGVCLYLPPACPQGSTTCSVVRGVSALHQCQKRMGFSTNSEFRSPY